jgi:hypothetical protein
MQENLSRIRKRGINTLLQCFPTLSPLATRGDRKKHFCHNCGECDDRKNVVTTIVANVATEKTLLPQLWRMWRQKKRCCHNCGECDDRKNVVTTIVANVATEKMCLNTSALLNRLRPYKLLFNHILL